jgi:hypothetical protein
MGPHRDYRYQLRKYPLRGGMTWRWWIFEGDDRSHIDTGGVVGADRDKAEAAAKDSIERRLSPQAEVTRPLVRHPAHPVATLPGAFMAQRATRGVTQPTVAPLKRKPAGSEGGERKIER